MKKWVYILIIAILFIATILFVIFINTPTAVATDTVDMEYFNKTVEELKATISTLETTTNEKITSLENKNAELQEQVTKLNNKVVTLQNNYSTLSNKISKIEAREDRLYETIKSGYYTGWVGYKMQEFKKAQ